MTARGIVLARIARKEQVPQGEPPEGPPHRARRSADHRGAAVLRHSRQHSHLVFRSTQSNRQGSGPNHEPDVPHREVTAEHRAALRAVAEPLPTGTILPLTREQVLTLLALSDTELPTSPAAGAANTHLLNAQEVATRLRVEKQWVYHHKKSLGAVKVGRALRFPPGAVDRYIARHSLSRLVAQGR